jgi:hypothetical protein
LDKGSPQDLVEEAIKMDIAIPKNPGAEVVRDTIWNDASLRIYEMREKALSDWTSGVNHAKREGIKEGRDEIIELLKSEKTPEEIIREYGSR